MHNHQSVKFWIDNYLQEIDGKSPDKKIINGKIDTIENNEFNEPVGFKGDVKDGKKNGIWIFKGSGKVYYIQCNYKEGILDGEYQLHYENDNIPVFVELHGNYKNGIKHGLWKVYENGQLLETKEY
tara:strand:- start:1645 stop:2022 length:378 start_codon:yes stop_codon:yes gene_type:complete